MQGTMQRVLVVGCPGAGKSTLARELGKRLALEVLHLDAYYWQAGWLEPKRRDWGDTVDALLQQPSWIMDGNYAGTLAVRLIYADTVIFLDMPRWLCLWRIGKRLLRYGGRTRPDMAADCPERFSWQFYEYVWNFQHRKRPGVVALIEPVLDKKRVVILRSPQSVQTFLNTLPVLTPNALAYNEQQ